MGFILKNTSGLINTRITDTGRQRISQGNFKIVYFQIGDSEVSYNVLPQSTYNQYNSWVLEPSFNAQNSSGVPQSNKENIKYPYFVDGITGNTYGIPFMSSIVEPVYNRAAPRGFFTGSSTNGWSAITNNSHVINSNYVVIMNSLIGSNSITISATTCNDSSVRPIQIGDFITLIYDGDGLDDCLCSTGTTTTTSTSTTTTTTNPCVTPLPTTTTTTTTCSFINPCCPDPVVTCLVNSPSCYPILTYRVVNVCNDIVVLDRNTPNYSSLSSSCYGRVLVYPSGMTEIYDFVTPSNHWKNDVINYESLCSTDQAEVKIWNMNIPWSEDPAGLDPLTHKDYTQFGSINYLGSKEYFGYSTNSAQTDTSSVFYYNSFDERITVTPQEQKSIAIVHYTNQSIDLFYGEKFALEPLDESTNDTTGQARNFKIDLPWLMWHKNPECCYGQSFYVDPPSFESLNLFEVHYIESTRNPDMNTPGIRYYHLWDTNANSDGYPSRVGKVFPDSKIIIFDDEEIVASMSYKSNRNWTLPAPKISLITPNILGTGTSNEGILSSSTEYLYVTYRLTNSNEFTNSLHCNYYSSIAGPNITCNPITSQNVAVRFGSEFNCMNTSNTPIVNCWENGIILFVKIDKDEYVGYVYNNTNQTSGGYPIYWAYEPSLAPFTGSFFNLYYTGTTWNIIDSSIGGTDIPISFSSSVPLGNWGDDVVGGFSVCSPLENMCVTVCPNNTTCLSGTSYVYYSGSSLSFDDSLVNYNTTITNTKIKYNSSSAKWQMLSGTTVIAELVTGSSNTPVGTWTNLNPNFTGVTTSAITTCQPISCTCFSYSLTPGDYVKWSDCYGVIQNYEAVGSVNYSGCSFTIDGIEIKNSNGTPGLCSSVGCTTTTTTNSCPDCDVLTGFYADKLEILCQKISDTSRPDSSEWRIIDVTDQISATTVNGYLTQSGLTGTTFVIDQDDYDNAPIYDLSDYINITPLGFSGYQLNFGDEFYFYGNIETDIQATIYEMIYKINLGQAEYQTPSNPTWSTSNKRYVTEVGLYNENKELMIISKFQSPVLRQGIQQILIKLDI